ncbi:MAG: hypothetical protein MJE66_00110 [Proteobacteria bacterium]|nr:hypothetical protein [Pseudomonadota bacterium]
MRQFARLLPALALLLLLSSKPSSATTVDLIDGQGALTWDTSISVGSLTENTSVTHPLYPINRHPHEGWFLFVNEGPGFLHEFTNFTKTTNGANQDVLTATYTTFFNETFQLDLTYGINAVGPQGLPDLAWTGTLFRPVSGATVPVLNVRLFNVFDYDVGLLINGDSATVTQTTGPNTTLVEIAGPGSPSGFRGAFENTRYSVDTLANVLAQIQTNNILNDATAPGTYDVAGAFEWETALGIGPGAGIGGIGGFGGFGAIPEPSTLTLLLGGLALLAGRSR